MSVDPATALSAGHGGETVQFCSPGCRDRFTTNPGDYLPAIAADDRRT
jgi:YHS domain-containing protein